MFRVTLEFVISALMSTLPATVSEDVLAAKLSVTMFVLPFDPIVSELANAAYPDGIVTDAPDVSMVTLSEEVGTRPQSQFDVEAFQFALVPVQLQVPGVTLNEELVAPVRPPLVAERV